MVSGPCDGEHRRLQATTFILGIVDLKHFVHHLREVMYAGKFYERHCPEVWEKTVAFPIM